MQSDATERKSAIGRGEVGTDGSRGGKRYNGGVETFVAWIQDNHLPLLGTQLAIVLAVGLYLGIRRVRASATAAEAGEPAKGDVRTVTLPEEDAAQMFETLTALQEELERYRKPASPEESAESVRRDESPSVFPEDDSTREKSNALPATMQGSPFWEDVEEEQRAFETALNDDTPMAGERSGGVETGSEEEASAADRVLRNWLEDVERLARRARRDSL